jgi:hypothetical protein
MTRKPARKPQPFERHPKDGDSHSTLWIGMIIFVATWTFMLGILVGRGSVPLLFDPKKIQVELAKRIEDAVQKKEALLKKYIDSPYPNLTFQDQLARSDQAENLHLKPQTFAITATPPPPLPVGGSVSSPHPAEVPDGIVSTTGPGTGAEAESVKPIQAATPANDQKSTIKTTQTDSPPPKTIQLRANPVPNRRAAENIVGKLKSKGYDAQIHTKMISGKGIWYEITVGNIKTQTEASELIIGLKQDNVDATAR